MQWQVRVRKTGICRVERSAISIFGTTSNLHTFWSQVKVEYLEIAKKTLKILIPFPTSYACVAGFSLVTVIKMR